MGFGMVLGHNSQHPKTISSLLKSQELYSRPTLDTPHFPKASWYVSSLYHILSYYIPLIPIVHVAKDESPHQSPSRVDASSSPATCWSGLKLKAPNGRHSDVLKSCFREDQMDRWNNLIANTSNTFSCLTCGLVCWNVEEWHWNSMGSNFFNGI